MLKAVNAIQQYVTTAAQPHLTIDQVKAKAAQLKKGVAQ
jgi:hypothetical protein